MAEIKKIFQNKKESGGFLWDLIFTLFFFLLALFMVFKYDPLRKALGSFFSQDF